MYKHIYNFKKLKKPLGFFYNIYENNKTLKTIKKFKYNKKLIVKGRLYFNFWGFYIIINTIKSIKDQHYFLLMINKTIKYLQLILNKKKFNITYTIKKRFNIINKKKPHTKIQYIKFNNIKKFLSLKKELKLCNIAPKYIIEYILKQNNVAEQFNKTIIIIIKYII